MEIKQYTTPLNIEEYLVYHTYHTDIFKVHVDSLRFKTELDVTWALCFFAVEEWKIHKWVSQNPSISGAQK